MLQLKYQTFQLPFQYPFTTFKGTKTHQPTLVVSLGLGNFVGFGEAPAISYYNVTLEGMTTLLEAKRPLIERYALTDPHRFWHFLHHLIPGQHALIAALDIAGWDLFAKMRRQPLQRLLQIDPTHAPICDYTLGMDTPENMVDKLKAHPWPIYKIKMGSPQDIDILKLLRQHTTAPFRIDANEGWQLDDALHMLPELAALDVTMIEQPLHRDEWEAMQELKSKSPIPLYADECCHGEADIPKCIPAFHGINIKLTKCGGITPALRMIQQARAGGLRVMCGSMNESTIGTAALATLAPLLDEIDADGPLLLSQDIATGVSYHDGKIQTSGQPGLGIRYTGLPKTE